jgi:hypothetical protein
MKHRGLLLSTMLAVALGALAPVGAAAQCRLCDSPTTQVDSASLDGPVSLRIEASLNFDQLILLGSGDGSVQLRPDGSSQVTGSVSAVSSRAMVGSATVRGEPGRAVRIDLPKHIELYSLSGARLSLDEIVSDLPSTAKLDSSGTLQFHFGGRIRLTGDAEGAYRGDLPITAEYL